MRAINIHVLNLCWAQIVSTKECPGGIWLFSLAKGKMGNTEKIQESCGWPGPPNGP